MIRKLAGRFRKMKAELGFTVGSLSSSVHTISNSIIDQQKRIVKEDSTDVPITKERMIVNHFKWIDEVDDAAFDIANDMIRRNP
ncbi:hypothetical protein M5K25_026779 [Dendrobium thyrsiflorum]|uniref:Uncharacterized protein n=1 Tax=Dendrobium thyrsiflorum TaxID=117978 RepID=A0ABD0TY89_DENTH